MALAFTRSMIKGWFIIGRPPKKEHFDSMVDAYPLVYCETVNLVADTDKVIQHDAGEKARMVQVTDSDGKLVSVNWRRDPSDALNKVIVNSAKAYTNAEVTILIK